MSSGKGLAEDMANAVQDCVTAYKKRLGAVAIQTGAAAACAAALYAIGMWSSKAWLLGSAILVLGIAATVFLFYAAPLVYIARLGARFASVMFTVKVMATPLVWAFLTAIAFVIFPLTERLAIVVPLAVLVLVILAMFFGAGFSPESLKNRVIGMMSVSVVASLLVSFFPAATDRLKDVLGESDEWAARFIDRAPPAGVVLRQR